MRFKVEGTVDSRSAGAGAPVIIGTADRL